MRKFIYSILMAVALGGFYGCDNSASSTGDEPAPNGPGPTMSGLTCLEAKGARLPSGTYAKRVSTGEKAYLNSNGCFSFKATTAAARSVATSDSVQFYNDSALFSVTIPYVSSGDTISIVPTVVSLRNCPKKITDSVFLVVFDRIHILSRRVKMKRADLSADSSEFGRVIWSVESANPFKMHFEVHNGVDTWPSAIITSEPGGTVSMNYSQLIREGALIITVPDTVFFFTEQASYCLDTVHIVTSMGDYADTCMYTEALMLTERVGVYKAGTNIGLVASSYGMAELKVDGIKASNFTVAASSIDPYAVVPSPKTVNLSVTDSAGYTKKKTIMVFSSKRFDGMVSDSMKTASIEYLMFDETYTATDFRGSLYDIKIYGYKKK